MIAYLLLVGSVACVSGIDIEHYEGRGAASLAGYGLSLGSVQFATYLLIRRPTSSHTSAFALLGSRGEIQLLWTGDL